MTAFLGLRRRASARAVVGLAGCALAIGVTACGSGNEPKSSGAGDGSFTVGLAQEPSTLDSLKAVTEPGVMVIRQVAEPLVQRDGNGKPVPILAASLPVAKDDLTWE